MTSDGDDEDEAKKSRKEGEASFSSSSAAATAAASAAAEHQVDNSGTVIAKIANLYAERLMSDVVLVVGTNEYPSHRLILCASSDVFQVMLMSPSWSESRETRVVLRETPSGEAVFEDFLRYLYTGKILLDYATVIPLVSLADKYNVRDLLRIGLDFMARNVSTACLKNQVVSWLQFAAAAGHDGVASLCRDFIAANFSRISDTIDFPNLEPDSLAAFLRRSDLVVEDEMVVFRCLDTWLRARREMMERSGEDHVDLHLERHVREFLPLVRFPMMTPAQLASLMLSPLSETHTELLAQKIRHAMKYHKNFLDVSLPPTAEERRLFTPRLYTCERFCASLSVDHFRNLQSYHRRGLVFAAQEHTAECMGEQLASEWAVEVYPKGVWFQRAVKVYEGTEVPERVLKTVRVSVIRPDEVKREEEEEEERGAGVAKETEERRVRVGVLVTSDHDGFEHVRKVVTRNYFFSPNDQVVNFDDVLDFDELRDPKRRSKFLCGPDGDSLRVAVVIAPLTKLSCLDIS